MTGLKRLTNIETLIRNVVKNNVAGDFMETGVWRSGSCIFANAMFHALRDAAKNRKVYVCDSFPGLPLPRNAEDSSIWNRLNYVAVSLEEAKGSF